jgi:hypothetical protein
VHESSPVGARSALLDWCGALRRSARALPPEPRCSRTNRRRRSAAHGTGSLHRTTRRRLASRGSPTATRTRNRAPATTPSEARSKQVGHRARSSGVARHPAPHPALGPGPAAGTAPDPRSGTRGVPCSPPRLGRARPSCAPSSDAPPPPRPTRRRTARARWRARRCARACDPRRPPRLGRNRACRATRERHHALSLPAPVRRRSLGES